jgi:hypothetical protein
MALRYFDRLIGLRGSGYLRAIDPTWWALATGNPIFAQARQSPEFLAPLA